MVSTNLMSRWQTTTTPAGKCICYAYKGMAKRVLAEHAEKAQQKNYHLKLAANPLASIYSATKR